MKASRHPRSGWWLRNEVVAAYDEMKEHPERGVSAEAVRARFAAKLTEKRR